MAYTPAADFSGLDSFTYQVCDGSALCDTAVVAIEVQPVADAPVAVVDSAVTSEDVAVSIPVLDNDVDADGDLVPSTLSVSVAPGTGTALVQSDASVLYTPDADANGPDTFTYNVCDSAGLCDSAAVSVVVAPVDDPPIAADDAVSTSEDTPIEVDVLANDTDVDGDLDSGSVAILTHPVVGGAEVQLDGTVLYTPTENTNGTDSFVYVACDLAGLCDLAIVMIDITPVNDAPMAVDDIAITDPGVPVSVTVLANDYDVDSEVLTPAIDTAPTNGTSTVEPDATVTYSPNAGYCGIDTFTYVAFDGAANSSPATVSVEVECPPNAPIAVDDAFVIEEDVPTAIDVTANDSDPDGDLITTSVTVATEPATGSAVVQADGSVLYTPAVDDHAHGDLPRPAH